MPTRADNFDRSNSSSSIGSPSDGGSGYIGSNGVAGISSNAAYFPTPAASGNAYCRALDCGSGNAAIDAVVKTLDFYGCIVARYTDDDNIGARLTTGPAIFLLEYVQSGTAHSIATVTTGFSASNGDTWTIDCSEDQITIKLNGTVIGGPYTVSFNQTETKFGIGSTGSSTFAVDSITITPGSGGPVDAGKIVAVCTPTSAAIKGDGTDPDSASASPSGGTGGYTYEWKEHASNPNFDYATEGTVISGETSVNIASVSGLTTTKKYIKRKTSDSFGTVAYSECAPVRLTDFDIKLGFVGDSLYQNVPGGYGEVALEVEYLRFLGGGLHRVFYFDGGQSGAQTGHWLPYTDPDFISWGNPGGGYFDTSSNHDSLMDYFLAQCAAAGGLTTCQLRLGTNDAVTSVSAANYGARLQTICDYLVSNGINDFTKVIVHYPTWASSVGNEADINSLILAYLPYCDAVVDNVNVFAGDTGLVDFSAIYPAWTTANVHPSDPLGITTMALAGFRAMERVLYGQSISGARLVGQSALVTAGVAA